MGAERRKAHVSYVSVNTIRIKNPYRSKKFNINKLVPLDISNLNLACDIIDLHTLKVYKSDILKVPPLISYVVLHDPSDKIRGRTVCVAVKNNANDDYKVIAQIRIGTSKTIDVSVVIN